MVLLRNSILWKHAQLSSMTGCRVSDVVHYKQIYKKSPPLKSPRLHIQMSHNPGKNGNLQRTVSITFLCWCHALSWHIIPPWATEKSQEAGTALHMLGALHSSYNAQDIYIYIYSSQKVWWAVFWWDLLPRSSLLAFCISMVIWNDWKWSRLTTKWCIRVGINQTLWLVSWLKCERQLSVAQLTPQTKKLKQMQNSNRWKVFWHHW